MIIVKLMGGLGNQMFQYALGKSISEFYKTELKLDLSFLLDRTPRENFVYRDYDLDIFNVSAKFASEEDLKKFLNPFSRGLLYFTSIFKGGPNKIIKEKHFHFDEEVLKCGTNAYLEGYWQSEKYFKGIEAILRKEFSFRNELPIHCKDIADRIRSSTSICINIRRGDFVSHPLHDVCDLNYFYNGAKFICNKIEKPHFFIFSDDIEWCNNNLHFDAPTTFVSHDYAGSKFETYLHLMSICKHYIIPNSTFAWWAAWINQDPKKIVVAPKKWFNDASINTNDLIPGNWIRV